MIATREFDRPALGISFDLSKTNTGVCIWLGQTPVAVLSTSFQPSKGLGLLMYNFTDFLQKDLNSAVKTVINKKDYTEDFHYLTHADWLAYEDVRPINKIHMEQHFGMAGYLHLVAWENLMPLYRVVAKSAKKILSGHGACSKETQLASAREQYPHLKVRNHDEADAIAVGLYAVTNFISWEGSEQRALPGNFESESD
jgi:hypothetical protein